MNSQFWGSVWDAVKHQLWVKVVLIVLTGSIGWVVARGTATIKVETKRLVMDTVKPSIDSMKTQIDTLKSQLEEVKAEQKRQGAVQQEFFGAMMEVNPALKKVVAERGKQNDAVIRKKAETETLLNNLTEEK